MEIFFHRMLVNFAVNFIVFIYRFEPRKEVTIIKDTCRAIILNVIPNSLNKGTIFKNMVNILNISLAKMTHVCNFQPFSN